jgi:hypothetical protein
MNRIFVAAASFAALALTCAQAQDAATLSSDESGQAGCHGTTLAGTVRDTTQALIPGANVTLDGGVTATSGSDGRFRIPCVADGSHSLRAAAAGFSGRDVVLKTNSNGTNKAVSLDVVLLPESVTTEVEVNGADDTPATSGNSAGPTQTISGKQLQSLADDPDDLARELQQLAAASGGNPANTTIAVDGFQGSSSLPPKSSIAYIKINPDQFAAEYRQPPFDGGRVEVYTKPGQKAYHGALFTTNGSSWENARDPFSTSSSPIGKQRYGLELSGPVQKKGSDFAIALEHRGIDNFAVVDAFTVTPTTVTNISENVATPQRLWLGTARVDWQLGAKNTFITSYSANVNHLANVGVGGTSLPETGYDSGKYEHMFRVSDITTASAHLMHEARLSLRWDGETDVPQSSATQVSVAGAFTGGGATIGQQRLKEFNVEFDDDAIWTTKSHTFKFGTQLMTYNEHEQLPTNFNGTYTFGGGIAPVLDANNNPTSQTETITGIQQYQRALSGYAGGTPTAYSNVAGTPNVQFTQLQDALFLEDDWKLAHGVQILYGLRYAFATEPTMKDGMTPRLGILWSPTKKGTWTLHAHGGIFTGGFGPRTTAEVLREDGVHRVTSTVYNPVYCSATSTGCSAFTGGTPIHSERQFVPGLSNTFWSAENIGGTRTLPHGWNLSIDYYLARIWNDQRTENINSPLNGAPTGPRALGIANTNILQVQNSGQGYANVVFAGIENHSYQRVQFFLGGVRVNLKDDTDDSSLASPQSAFSDAGEFAYRDSQPIWNVFGNATVNLPGKVVFSSNFNGNGEAHYNITTGFDNNGDGDFNDRPQYALPGQAGAIQTQYGALVASGGTGVFPRDKGVLPWRIYLDANVQRAFKITRNAKAEHQQTLTLNVRSSNVLNHENVTSVGGVLGSPLFGVPYAADNGRRIEAGARYTF